MPAFLGTLLQYSDDGPAARQPHLQCMSERRYFIYILASHTRVLYVGMTSRISARLAQHRANLSGSFTARYRVHRLVYCEVLSDASLAVRREREIKAWRREKKLALIRSQNPDWKDLVEEWVLD